MVVEKARAGVVETVVVEVDCRGHRRWWCIMVFNEQVVLESWFGLVVNIGATVIQHALNSMTRRLPCMTVCVTTKCLIMQRRRSCID